jgi:hypothetical protein
MWLNRVTVERNGQASYSSLTDDCLMALGHLQISPTATVLNYGQALFESLSKSG